MTGKRLASQKAFGSDSVQLRLSKCLGRWRNILVVDDDQKQFDLFADRKVFDLV